MSVNKKQDNMTSKEKAVTESKLRTKPAPKNPNRRKKGGQTIAQQIYMWEKRTYVDTMIDNGASRKALLDYFRGQGFEVSWSALSRYIEKRAAAIEYKGFADFNDFSARAQKYNTMTPLSEAEREENRLKQISKTNVSSEVRASIINYERETQASTEARKVVERQKKLTQDSSERIMTDIQFLDIVIQKGFETVAKMPSIDPGKAIKAIELKHKLTQGTHGGLTVYGMEEIRLREQAREAAMTDVILGYVDEEKRSEMLDRLEIVTEQYYDQQGLKDAYTNPSRSVESYLKAEGDVPEDDSYYMED